MAKIQTARAKRTFDELSAFTNQQSVIDALERAGKDRALLRSARKDGRAFLKGEGLRLPPRADVTISERRIAINRIRISSPCAAESARSSSARRSARASSWS